LDPTNAWILGDLGYTDAVSGNRDEALGILENLNKQAENVDVTVWLAKVYAGLGDRERAFEWLEKGFRRRSIFLRWLKSASEFDVLRSDPRFTDLVRRVGLPP